MNDHEPFTNQTDVVANAGPSSTDQTPVVALTLGDIQARRDEIAAAILRPDLSSRASVAALVALFSDNIATALVAGRSWAGIASALSTSGIAARPDAVRMAYRRLLDRPHDPSARPPFRPTTTDQPIPTQRSPDPPRSADTLSRKPSLARRVR